MYFLKLYEYTLIDEELILLFITYSSKIEDPSIPIIDRAKPSNTPKLQNKIYNINIIFKKKKIIET